MTDFDAIQNLVVAERMYRVSHRNKELAECYAPDASIHISWQNGGVSSFVGKEPVEAQKSLPIVNRCNPPLIRINQTSDRAVVEYPMTTTRELMVNGEEAVLTSFMLLVERVEKINGEWKIIDMTSINEYDTLAPAIPGVDLKINPDDVKDLRESYRWLAYTRMLAGGQISQDLEGTDRPESVRQIYDAADSWLNNE
ncbi:MAG: hypothetical protein K2M68_00680 [Muribaculaceae bacterium]|nr:hypothetical protein [Muribaculaceae bacterium]